MQKKIILICALVLGLAACQAGEQSNKQKTKTNDQMQTKQKMLNVQYPPGQTKPDQTQSSQTGPSQPQAGQPQTVQPAPAQPASDQNGASQQGGAMPSTQAPSHESQRIEGHGLPGKAQIPAAPLTTNDTTMTQEGKAKVMDGHGASGPQSSDTPNSSTP